MIYAIIIILALAIAFIILIRRLPGAFTPGKETVSEPQKQSSPKFKMPSFSMPKVSMPKLPSLPKREPVSPVAPAVPVATPPTPPVAAPVSKPAWKLPSLSLPKREAAPKPVEQPAEVIAPKETKTTTDFWDQGEKLKPISEPSPVVAKLQDKPKAKNVTDDADSAFMSRDYRKAERLYVRLAADDPKNPKIYSRLGIIYLEQSNFEDARDAFQQAIKLEPTVATRHFNLALVYMHLGSKAKATAAMELALKYDPSNRKYRKMLDNIMAGRV